MTISEALRKYSSVEIELLLAHVLKKPKEFVFLNQQLSLSASQQASLAKMVKRRLAGEPVAYILGYKDFYGLRFKVSKDVLIPRPETEWLVDRALGVILKAGRPEESHKEILRRPAPQDDAGSYRTLDLGTGSGCIAISLAKNLPEDGDHLPELYASDISGLALKVAKQNAKIHKVKIKFIASDLFRSIDGKFDIIIANLPYVPFKMYQKYLAKNDLSPANPFSGLKFEPMFALTDGTKSFQIYRRFFEQVGGFINKGGLVLLEIDPSSKKFLLEYQKKYLPKADIKFYKDFNNLWRFAEIKIN